MATNRINVLIYAGNGSTIESVRHCLYTFRRLLSPHYAVIPVNETALIQEPWIASCALLIFPGGADLGYCRSLDGQGNARITQYVRRGGAYLGLCAGGYYGSARCEFELGDKKMEVVGSRELAFFPGTCRGCAFKGFVYNSEAGARAAELRVDKEALGGGPLPTSFKSYYNGGGVFTDAAKMGNEGVEVLASFTDPIDVDGGIGGLGSAAVVYCEVGQGCAILTGPHPEFSSVNLDSKSGGPGYDQLVKDVAADEEPRSRFLAACLTKMGLRVVEETPEIPSLSHLHLSSMNHMKVLGLLDDLKQVTVNENGENYVKGEHDTFLFEQEPKSWSLGSLARALPVLKTTDRERQSTKSNEEHPVKRIVLHKSSWPGVKETPYFNHYAFYANLRRYQDEKSSEAEDFGKLLLYGEVVTSTNSMLEKNPSLLTHLPTGFTAVATTQVAGRGRGTNPWVSPRGSLLFSTCIRYPAALTATAPVVYVQYLAAMAVVEGIKSYDHGYAKVPVKLKWPNDIYAEDPGKRGSGEYVKIGGILVNSSFSDGNYDLVVGIGLNTSNISGPTTSLNAILSAGLAHFTLEKLLARILTTFETMYNGFMRSGFDAALEKRYYAHWLHADQIVTLEQEGGVRARVLGISRDYGMLRVEELGWEGRRTGKIFELQSDSNSFDFIKGLLKRKI